MVVAVTAADVLSALASTVAAPCRAARL
eukprot:COSAG01_NODE_23483_length_813_cov_2.310924_1_plen_27_part_10